MVAVANKQQFRKEQDNKEGHEKEHGNFCLKHSLINWQQLRETVGM